MQVSFLDAADDDLADAFGYYDKRHPGLGVRFSAQVERAIERIVRHPEAWSKLSRRTRRCLINVFPYGVIYQIRDDDILVIAIMHLHQDPRTWRSRLPRGQR